MLEDIIIGNLHLVGTNSNMTVIQAVEDTFYIGIVSMPAASLQVM